MTVKKIYSACMFCLQGQYFLRLSMDKKKETTFQSSPLSIISELYLPVILQ